MWRAIVKTMHKGSVTYRFCPWETSYMDVGGQGGGVAPVTFLREKLWKISKICCKFLIFWNYLYKAYKIQHFRVCIYVLSIFVCRLSSPDLVQSVLLIACFVPYYVTLGNMSHTAICHTIMCVTFGCFPHLLTTCFPEAKQMQNDLWINLFVRCFVYMFYMFKLSIELMHCKTKWDFCIISM